MEKSIFTAEHRVFTTLLRESRRAAGLTQVDLAEKLDTSQSIVSKWERGELRVDFVQVQAFCRVVGVSLANFSREFERRTRVLQRSRRRRR
jgi:ribosome-binding protein aMBF1 (putative translation factor)